MKPIHILAAILINVIFGTPYPLGHLGVVEFPPLMFAAMRALATAMLLSVFMKPIPKTDNTRMFSALLCLTMGVGVFAFLYLALASTKSVSTIIVVSQTALPISIIIGWITLGEAPNRLQSICIACAIIGIIVLAADESLFSSVNAMLLMTVSAFFYGSSLVIMRRLKSVSALNLSAWVAWTSAPSLALLSLLIEENQLDAMMNASLTGWVIVLYSAIAVSVIGHAGNFALLRLYPVHKVASFYVIFPVSGIIISALLFDEVFTEKMILGGTITIAAVVALVTWGNRTPKTSTDTGG